MFAPDTLFHDRYRVVRRIKGGGMGEVYEVVDETTRRRRALKVMLPNAIEVPSLRERFTLEATITGEIESDHIVQVSDAGVDETTDMPFLVMDMLSGEELGELLKRRGPLPVADVALYLFQAALALDKTQAKGIVHRDLKPENMFVTQRDDGSPCLKILDFGVAKLVVETTLSKHTAVVGTVPYMAPEQIKGDREIDPRADIYGLGHVAYTLLTGEAYWMTEAKFALAPLVLFNKILTGLPESASTRAAKRGIKLPPAFDAWFEKAVATDPKKRFEKASAAAAAFAEVFALAPTQAATQAAVPTVPPPSSSRPVALFNRLEKPAPIPPPPRARERERAPLPPPARAIPAGPISGPAKPRQAQQVDDVFLRPEEPPAPASARTAKNKMPAPADSWDDPVPLFRDEATYAYTERYLKVKLDEEIHLAKKWGEKLSILLFEAPTISTNKADIDAEVRELVLGIQRFVKRDVFLGRYGQTCVVMILRGAGRTKVRAISQVLDERVRGYLSKQPGTTRLAVKMRIGFARADMLEKSAVDLIERAAKAARDGAS